MSGFNDLFEKIDSEVTETKNFIFPIGKAPKEVISNLNRFIYPAQVSPPASAIQKLSWDSCLTAAPSWSYKTWHCDIEPDNKNPGS